MQTAPIIAINRPYAVESWQWDGTTEQGRRIIEWMEAAGTPAYLHPYENLLVIDMPYAAGVRPNQWAIRDQFGEFFPLDDADYQAAYTSPVLR
jgi:hypothetical protein